MKIVTEIITLDNLKVMAENMFGDLVKAVVDIDREFIAVDAELHSDLRNYAKVNSTSDSKIIDRGDTLQKRNLLLRSSVEALLLENGSQQKSLWGGQLLSGYDRR